jgi:hypothetical protein
MVSQVLTKSEIGEEDGRLDAENVDVVEHLDGEGGLSSLSDQRDRLRQSLFRSPS